MVKFIALFFILTAVTYNYAAPTLNLNLDALTVTLDENTICTFLPRTWGGDIGASESDAVAFCSQENTQAPGANPMPTGFIQSYHYLAEDGYVQYTGRIDISAYGLSSTDGGGQYDNAGGGSPPGAICGGYEKFVNLIEPDIGLYCIRCCTDADKCDTGHSTDGCESVIPGDYS
ncbi:11821_t:CDS:1 [Funneliformis geosporum]|uniref:16613_t:CDS:1 n=1 Tax=Funneliformis geosporum TaxID=1117311 RepID=A0A9W4SGF7_9GLOM|nr:16613_t:CDS:1 [Funneliformis geosporum]CAI2179663.1 11821_t:CDS:1 [Funneliformis geosporum]